MIEKPDPIPNNHYMPRVCSGAVAFTLNGVFYAPFEQRYDAQNEGEQQWQDRVFAAVKKESSEVKP